MDRFDEQLLLALIEDELSPKDANELRRRLEARPDLREELDAMRSDRLMLRSEPEPAMPGDFLERVEGRLARPMLFDPAGRTSARSRGAGQPGASRPRHQPRRGWRTAARMALAAGVLLLITGSAGLIAIGTGALDRNQLWSFGGATTESEPERGSDAADHDASTRGGAPQSADGVVHHYGPRGLGDADFGSDSLGAAAGDAATAPDTGVATPLDFVLVVRAEDVARAEQRVQGAVLKLSTHNALVQNMSVDEARHLEAQWLAANAAPASPPKPAPAASEVTLAPGLAPGGVEPASDGRVAVSTETSRRARTGSAADATPTESATGDLTTLARRAQEQILREPAAADAPSGHGGRGGLDAVGRRGPGPAVFRQLAGPRDRAATIQQQIAFSKRGATHTITIPASQLDRLLDDLHDDRELRTELQVLPEPPDAAEVPTRSAEGGDPTRQQHKRGSGSLRDLWLLNNAIARQRFEMLRRQHADRTVYLPIIIEAAPPTPPANADDKSSDSDDVPNVPAREHQDG